jgi:hypothetical protein
MPGVSAVVPAALTSQQGRIGPYPGTPGRMQLCVRIGRAPAAAA